MSSSAESNVRPHPDLELVAIADFVVNPTTFSDEALSTARYCLLDSLVRASVIRRNDDINILC